MATSTGVRHPVRDQLAGLRAEVAGLAVAPLFGVPDAELPDLLGEAYQLVAQAEAFTLAVLAQADVVEATRKHTGAAGTQAWLFHTAHLRAGLAKRHRLAAEALLHRPRLGAALAAGRVSLDQAEAIIDGLHELPSDTGPSDTGPAGTADVEALLLDAAADSSVAQLKELAAIMRYRLDPDRADTDEAERLARQERDARDRRYLRYRRDGYGSVYDSSRLSLADAAVLLAVLDTLAKPRPTADGTRDTRTADQRNADALVELAQLAGRQGDLPANGGDRPRVVVTINHRDLTRRDRGHGEHVDLHEHLSVAAIRALARDGDLTAVVLNDQGQPLHLGRSQRLFNAAQRLALALRDRHCLHPGCDRPPRWCDAHHITHWANDGPTNLDSAALLCSVHHPLYDRDEWQVITGPHGPTHALPPPFIDLTQTPIPRRRE